MADGEIAYRILSLVGEGGFGKVYRARQETREGFHKDVALKLLTDDDPPKSLLARFRDEARILGLVRDRAIVRVEPPIRLGGRWAVVMEFVDGDSCGSIAHQHGRIPSGVAVEIVGEVARALHNAYHMPGPEGQPLELLHRDIKPDNVQVTPSGDVRLLDFGIARANFAGREFKTRMSLGGTPGYIAPERLDGIETPAGDVYSLGVLLHEIVLGTKPVGPISMEFTADDRPVIDPEDLDLPDDVSPDELRVVELAGWMRHEDHTKRPTARQVEEACRRLRSELPPPFLRDWAEEAVSQRAALPPDDRVGQVFYAGSTAATQDSLLNAPVTQDSSRTLAMGGVVAGGLGLGLGLGLAVLALGALGLTAILMYSFVEPRPVAVTPPPVEARAPAPEPEPVPAAPAPAPEPEPVAPAPAPAPAPRIIVLPGASAPGTPVPSPSPRPAPTGPGEASEAPAPPATSRGSGHVVVRTVPSGARVLRNGQELSGVGNRYELPVGSHVLKLVSEGGKSATLPVTVQRGGTVEICYSFDANAACAP